ncbi:hypothetical protein [Campylobacter sp. RM16192]|uniref:hypothetical protein n=1 Tax=Campylobacter sp. RM16192 TaxID=1660080 RepID=UPI0014518024|nr:hypothetical protein [Campylobacter sp. RM16192]QCD52229.1 hypothetical protein CDOMC_0592 [Campylobacter sp. RM16192]
MKKTLIFFMLIAVSFGYAKNTIEDNKLYKEKIKREEAIISFKNHLQKEYGLDKNTIWFVDNNRNDLYKKFPSKNSKISLEYNKEEKNLFDMLEDGIRKSDSEIGYIVFYTEEFDGGCLVYPYKYYDDDLIKDIYEDITLDKHIEPKPSKPILFFNATKTSERKITNEKEFEIFYYLINVLAINSDDKISNQISKLPFINPVTISKADGEDLTEQEKTISKNT